MILPSPTGAKFHPADRHLLGEIARRIVAESHAKTQADSNGWKPTPIGPGGKIDDTSCVVAQVVEWTEEHGEAWAEIRSKRMWRNVFTCGGQLPSCEDEYVTSEYEVENGAGTRQRNYPAKPNANSFSTYWGSFSEYGGGGIHQTVQPGELARPGVSRPRPPHTRPRR